jgi:hypothetical protein
MLQLEHKRRIVDACYPSFSEEMREAWRVARYEPTAREVADALNGEALQLWHDIKPIKFGGAVAWSEVVGANELAAYQVPQDASYLLILRVECYTTTFVAAAPGFGQFSPPPNSSAFWAYTDASSTSPERLTPVLPIHVLCDSDEFLFAKGDHRMTLISDLPAPPDGNARFIRTLVYGYLLGALVAGRIGDSESTYDQFPVP